MNATENKGTELALAYPGFAPIGGHAGKLGMALLLFSAGAIAGELTPWAWIGTPVLLLGFSRMVIDSELDEVVAGLMVCSVCATYLTGWSLATGPLDKVVFWLIATVASALYAGHLKLSR